METQDLFQSCRRGDVEQVRYLAEHKELDVNVRDKWDSTPLYYACLCGHLELVRSDHAPWMVVYVLDILPRNPYCL